MKIEKLLTDQPYLLQKTEGNGGWTYAEIPEIPLPKTPFGMLKVKGTIDDYAFSQAHLMPIGNGKLGFPVRAEIRKKLKKQAGDTVHLTLYEDQATLQIPEELLLCMEYEEGLLEKFQSYPDPEKKAFIDWIYSAKTEHTQAERIARTLDCIQKKKKWSTR